MGKIFSTVSEVRASIDSDLTVTLIAGCFDLLHVGHLRILEYAKKCEDVLVVCVLSDAGVRSYKTKLRPVITDLYRAEMVAALGCVDRVYIADKSPSDYDTLLKLNPQSLVYGLENNPKSIEILENRVSRIKNQFPNVKIHYSERRIDPPISTTSIIEKILQGTNV